MDFNNIENLLAHVQKEIDKSLNDNVAKQVKSEISKSVKDVVYSTYPEPNRYKRRNLQDGSLGDTEMMNHMVENGILEVSDNADFKTEDNEEDNINRSYSLAYNIEKGYGNRKADYNKPRKFMEEAVKEMQESKSHVQALVNGLIERGIDVDGKSFK